MSRLLGPIGERLRDERVRLGLKQEQLAERAGISKNSLGAYERGATAMNVALLLVFQDLKIDIGYVLTGRRTDRSLDTATAQLIEMVGKLSVRERQAIFNLVSNLAGETIGTDELQAMSNLRAALHSPTRNLKEET